MAEDPWKPHATVAALCEHDGRYLLVRERVDGREVYNQPAGHLDPGESLLQAVVRETMEETRYLFEATALQGIYRFQPRPDDDMTYLRFLFRGRVLERIEGPLDEEIIAAEWLTYDELLCSRERHRSPLVLAGIEDSRRSPGYPLDIISQDFC